MADAGSDDWLGFVARSGREGSRWVAAYRQPSILEADSLAARALFYLRGRHIAEGVELLRHLEEHLRTISAPVSISCVLDRWYLGVLSYYQYCMEDYDESAISLERANTSLTAAIALERALLPLANHCQEFRLHFARIARNRRRWAEMRGHIDVAHAMITGGMPLCLLADGTTVDISDVCGFIEAIGLDDEERTRVAGLLDEELRQRLFDRFVAGIYAVPGFVIPYAPL